MDKWIISVQVYIAKRAVQIKVAIQKKCKLGIEHSEYLCYVSEYQNINPTKLTILSTVPRNIHSVHNNNRENKQRLHGFLVNSLTTEDLLKHSKQPSLHINRDQSCHTTINVSSLFERLNAFACNILIFLWDCYRESWYRINLLAFEIHLKHIMVKIQQKAHRAQ